MNVETVPYLESQVEQLPMLPHFVDPEIPEAPVSDGPLHAPDEVESIVVQAERPVVVD